MTVAIKQKPEIAVNLINGILSIKPLANFARHQARQMIIKRAERIGVPWRQASQALLSRDWSEELHHIENPDIEYPEYYFREFHAYEAGNMSWEAAAEAEVAARSVHASLWPDMSLEGDIRLRQSYHQALGEQLPQAPRDIVDFGCSIGLSTCALQDRYPDAQITGVELSPYFLAVAYYRAQQENRAITWVHNPCEHTGLPDAAYDLVSICLVCHELPQSATQEIFREARRLLRPQGHLAIMDMNPQSEVYVKMPSYVFTLLKSTEPYLDQYFALDIEGALIGAGFHKPSITRNTPRHRTIVAPVAD